MIDLRDCTVHETTASVWHYHIVLGECGDAICGYSEHNMFREGLPAEAYWSPSMQTHLPVLYCSECRALVGNAEGTVEAQKRYIAGRLSQM